MERRELWWLPDGYRLREPVVVDVSHPEHDVYEARVRGAEWISSREGTEEVAIIMLAYKVLDWVEALRDGRMDDCSAEWREAVQKILDKVIWDEED